ncbi:glycosyltransferase [Macrococcoides canis]|uniref:glycosyltransferase n=1 Tax=Macrococcoides canis TaxID=1855823 RepID=UPI00105B312A|nr:glycosyltransferase [Macrococcus canis]TDM32445.1 glycosyltransferase [Macrococcus canis]
MEINLLIPSKMHSNAGGVEKWINYFLENINYIDNLKINVYCFKVNDDEKKISDKFYENVTFHFVNYNSQRSGVYNMIKYYYFASKILFKKNIINVYIGSINLAPLIVFSKRNIVWIRSKAIGEQVLRKKIFLKPILELLEKITILKSDYLIFNGYDTEEFYLKKYNFKCKKKVIPNATKVDYKFEKPTIHNPLRIAYTGRYISAKGFDFFETISLSLKNENIIFNAYGFGKRINDDYKIVDNGKYEESNLIEILESNDVILFLNRQENSGGISHSLLEAMAMGKIIIAWDNRVHNQVLNSSNSILIQEGSSKCLENAIMDVVKNPEKYFVIMQQAYHDSKKYSIKNHMKKFAKVLEEMQ